MLRSLLTDTAVVPHTTGQASRLRYAPFTANVSQAARLLHAGLSSEWGCGTERESDMDSIRKAGAALGLCLTFAMGTQAATVTWDGGAGDNLWNSATNWNTDYVPSSSVSDGAVLAASSHNAIVSAPVTRGPGANFLSVTMRNGATLDIHDNMDLGNGSFLIGTTGDGQATVTQDAGTVSAKEYTLGLASGSQLASHTLSGSAALTLRNDLTIRSNSRFTVSESGVSVQVGDGAGDDLIMTGDGELKFVLGATGVSAINVFNEFNVAATSVLTIDGTGYSGGNAAITLVNAANMVGTFSFANYIGNVTGLGTEGVDWTLTQGINGDVVLNVIQEPAANLDWDAGAMTNVGWHTVANWDGDILPGSTTNHTVILDGTVDAPFVVQAFNSANPFDITVRNEAVLTVQANLNNVDDFYLGINANTGGGRVDHNSGAVSAKQVRVGASASATSDSGYTLRNGAVLMTTADLYVGMGTFRIDGPGASVTVGNNLDLSAGGDVTLQLGEYGTASFDVTGTMIINETDSVLTVDGSFYRGGSGQFELIRFGGISGSFATTNVVIKGFKANQSASISVDADSVDLIVTTDAVADLDSQLWFSMTPPAGTGSAETSDLQLNNEHHISTLASPDLTCVQTNAGNDLVYTVVWTGNDFDADGSADTLTFDLRVKAYTGTSFDYSANAASSSITGLGSTGEVTENNGRWGVGSDTDLDEGESLQFQVENVQISVPDYAAEIKGFTAFGLNEVGGTTHQHIRGEGVGSNLNSNVINFPLDYSFDALNPLMVTCAGTANYYGFQIDSIEFSMNVRNPDLDPVWDVSDYSYMKDGVAYVEPYPEQQPGVDFPEFSWDTVPRWLAVRNINAYSADQISTIATNYQLVMLEKSNKNGLTYTEEGQLKMAADLKAVSPDVKVITYWNSQIHYPDYEAALTYEPENWSLKEVDSNGNVSYKLRRNLLYQHNYSNEELRDWWVNVTLTMASDENVDGVFIDIPEASNPHFYDENGDPQTAATLMYDELRSRMPANKMLVGNALRVSDVNGHRQSLECFDGSYLEGWKHTYAYFESLDDDHTAGEIIGTSIQLMREALARGKMINLQSGPGTNDEPEPAGMDERRAYAEKYVDFPLAVFLIVAETNAYFGYNMGVNAIEESYNTDVWDTSYISAFNRPLGAPLGDPTRNGYVYTRSYEHVDVWVNVGSGETVFAWDSVDTDADGLNDLWEYRNFGNVTNAVPTDNPDGDAYTNEEEYIAGLNPLVADSFDISGFVADSSNTLEWSSNEGRTYNVYWSSNLVDGFTLIESNLVDGTFIDTDRTGEPKGFYKITVELED
ncbi:putative glycoside hydrolase [Pontiellaceae bacterium B12227]|nr:putative glycoside hydrolase [Pontiellaceae bacterium B12227]